MADRHYMIRTMQVLAGVLCLATALVTATSQSSRDRAAALAAVAEQHAAAGRRGDAVRAIQAAERLAPDWPELKVNLAAIHSDLGDYGAAIATLRRALTLSPALDGAWVNLGLAQLKSGDPEAAARTLDRFTRRPDAPPAAMAALAVARVQLGDRADAKNSWAAAERAYRGALAADPMVPRGHYSLGLVLFKQRRYDEAAAEFDRELDIDPAYAPALYYRAELELDRGNAAAALPLLARATTGAPKYVDGWKGLGRARLESGDPGGAVTALREAAALAPDDASAHFLLGRALQAAGHPVEARAALAKATELNQRHREALQRRVSGRGGAGASTKKR